MDGEKETRKDVLLKAGQPSPGAKSNPSKASQKTFTKSEVDKMLDEKHSKLDKTIAQLTSERDTLKKDLESNKSRLDALEREQNESRLAEARNDPEALRIYQREQTLVKRERQVEERDRDMTRREGQLKEDRAEVDKDRGVVSIAYIAAKYGLDTEELESLGISDPDTLEKVAEKLAAGKAKGTGEGEGGEGEGGEGEGGEGEGEFKPDSGEGAGGAGKPTHEQREKMSMAEYAKQVAKEQGKK